MAVAASDLIGDLIAQTPQGKVLQSKFKGLADIALAQAKQAGCTYADIRFTRSHEQRRERERREPRFDLGGFGGGGGSAAAGAAAVAARRRWRRRTRRADSPRPWRGRLRSARHPQRRLGLREQPDRDRGRDQTHHRMATEVAKASAIAKRADVKLAPVPAYTEYWATPIKKDPDDGFAGREAGVRAEGHRSRSRRRRRSQRQRRRCSSTTSGSTSPAAKAPTSSRRPGRRRRNSP